MEYKRMSTKDMLQYCDEALAWEEFGPFDIFFFESVKRILLGQCPAMEEPEADELADVTTPITAEELISYDEGTADLKAFAEETNFGKNDDYVIADSQNI